MGAVRTAGRGREVDASEKKHQGQPIVRNSVDIPPDDECTLTVGLEAIVGDLEGLLNLHGDGHTHFVRPMI